MLDLDDVELYKTPAQLLKAATKAVGLRTGAADNHPGTSGVDVDLDLLVTDPLDIDTRDRAPLELTTQIRRMRESSLTCFA